MSNGGGVLRRPAVPLPVRTRRDVNNLAANDPIITLYRDAIGVMKGRDLRDPTSLRYQAAIHSYPSSVATTADRRDRAKNVFPDFVDPRAEDRDYPLPTDRDTFWRQCQHGSWFFLSWHRMYIHFFEKMIMDIVKNRPGGSDWALPYWNYSASDAAALLPAPFRGSTLPDGTTNHLFVPERMAEANDGKPFLDMIPLPNGRPSTNRDPAKPHTSLNFLRQRPPARGGNRFLGPVNQSHFSQPFGSLESVPHGSVHVQTGGANGFMTDFVTAPLDPIFWLHHCNVDRLWEVWVQRQKQLGNLDRNPKNAGRANIGGWLDEPFEFHDETKARVPMTSRQVLNSRLPPLSYEYEDTSDPFNGAPNT